MKNVHEPTYSFVILTLILIIIDTILAYASVKFMPADISGISYIFPAVAFMILFTLWFGAYGAVAAYIGTLVGSGLLAVQALADNPGIAIFWAIAGLLQVLIPLVAVRSFEVDLTLANQRDINHILLFGVLINNLVGAVWAAWTLSLIEPGRMGAVFLGWFIGNIIVTLLIVPISLRLFTPKIQKSKLFVRFYWE